MSRTFERFLRTFSDEDLVAFVADRAGKQPPYWRTLELALRVEEDRRGIELGLGSHPGRASASSGRTR